MVYMTFFFLARMVFCYLYSWKSFIVHYGLLMDQREVIFRNRLLGSAPLDWYIPSHTLTAGRRTAPLSLGQLLFILEKLEVQNEGKRIHKSWLEDKEAWNELIRFTLPAAVPDPFLSHFGSRWPSERTAIQQLKEQAILEVPASPLYLALEEVAEELRNPGRGIQRKSEKLQNFDELVN